MMGKGPMSPRRMKQMQGKMKTDELEGVEEVIIRFADKEIHISQPEVSRIRMGAEIYQVMGSGIERPRTTEGVGASPTVPSPISISEDDVKLIMSQTGASEKEAKKALEEETGDLAGAIVKLKTKKG